MAKKKRVVVWSESFMDRIEDMVESYERNLDDTPGRRRRQVVGDGGGCDAQNAIVHVTIFGRPSLGTFTQTWTIDGTSEPITFNHNDNAAAVKTALAGHSKIAMDDLNVTGGPFPNATMSIEFKTALKNTDIALPVSDWDDLTGGISVAVISSLARKGHS